MRTPRDLKKEMIELIKIYQAHLKVDFFPFDCKYLKLQFYLSAQCAACRNQHILQINNKFIMYNSFIHEQRVSRFKEIEESRLKEAKWHKRYQTEVQPYLLQHYDKRIKSFIHNMGQKPIQMNPERRERHNERVKTLVFRNVEDWRSYYDIRERQEIKDHQRYISLKSMKQTGKIMPAAYKSPQRQYRSRSKQREIHPPMRYSSYKKQQNGERIENKKKPTLRELIKLQKAKEKERNKFQLQPLKPNLGILLTTHHSVATSKQHDQQQGDFLKHERTQNIQIQARMYEKQREVVEKRLHFKKLLDLSVKNPNEGNRKQYKTILQRCGLMPGKKGSVKVQTTELDKFTSLMQTTDKQRQSK